MSSLVVVVLLYVSFFKEIKKINIKYLFWSILTGVVISFPVILSLINGQAERLTIFSIFSYPRPLSEIETYKDSFFGLFHSHALNYFRIVFLIKQKINVRLIKGLFKNYASKIGLHF